MENISNLNQYIIAEVGQNHQGSKKIALEYIEVFSKLGASAIKFQTRDIETLFDKSLLIGNTIPIIHLLTHMGNTEKNLN